MDAASSVGLGLDIAGATIIAIGLLGNPAHLAMRATSFWGESAPNAAFLAESKADGEIGIPTIVAGFVGQLIGLAWRAKVAVVLGLVLAGVCTLGVLAFWYWIYRPRRVTALAIEIAHYNVTSSKEPPERLSQPVLDRLASIGTGLGNWQVEGEEDEDYVRRVFGVTETIHRNDL